MALRILLADWLVLLAMAIVLAGVDFGIAPYERVIPADDPTLMYPYLGYETIPTWALVVIAVVLPLICILIVSVTSGHRRQDLEPALLGFAMATITTLLLTDATKVAVGRLRPDFYARCVMVGGVCTGEASVVTEGRKSFMSGHASLAFAGLGYLSLYVSAKLRVFTGRRRLWKVMLVLVPLVVAYLIALSRVSNYVHHWQDVLIGGLLGVGLAYLGYRHYYPAVTDESGALPYSALDGAESSWGRHVPLQPAAPQDEQQPSAGTGAVNEV